jgi:hypothetical protein
MLQGRFRRHCLSIYLFYYFFFTEDPDAARALQETLSEHLDAVEHVLMCEIQARPHVFCKPLLRLC